VNKRRLGTQGLETSALGLGCMGMSEFYGTADEGEAIATIHRALELGVNLLDTADAYGPFKNERLVGRAIKDRRDEVVLATKFGIRRDETAEEPNRRVIDGSPENVRRSIEGSLQRLGTDHVDLYYQHRIDPDTPIEETVCALAELVQEGKIRHAGVSNFDADQMEAFGKDGPLETLQPPYDMFRRTIEESVLPYCRSHDIGVLVYGPLAHGLLTGAMRPSTQFAVDDWRSTSPDFTGDPFRRNLGVVDELKQFAADRDLSLPALAIAWTLANPAVDAAIVGTRDPAHLTDSVRAVDVRLSNEDLAEIDRILTRSAPVRGPAPEAMPKAPGD